MRYIEFFGLPGAGKSTFADHVVHTLFAQQRGVFHRWNAKQALMQRMVQSRSGMLWRGLSLLIKCGFQEPLVRVLWGQSRYVFLLSFLQTYPDLIRQVVEYASSIHPQPDMDSQTLVTWFCDVACVYQAARQWLRPQEILLWEEGFCQQVYYLIVAFRQAGLDERKIAAYLQLIPKPDAAVLLLADPNQCEARMHSRSKGIANHLRMLSPAERIAVLEQRFQTYLVVAQELEARNVTVIRLETTEPGSASRMLAERLAAL